MHIQKPPLAQNSGEDPFTNSVFDFNLDLLYDNSVQETIRGIESLTACTDNAAQSQPQAQAHQLQDNYQASSTQQDNPGPSTTSATLTSIASQTKKCSLPNTLKTTHTACGTSPVILRDHCTGTHISLADK